MKSVLVALGLLAMGFILTGCRSDTQSAKTNEAQVVVVGLENSRFAGSCPGAGYDADRIYKLLKGIYPASTVLLRDSNATKANVVNALKNAIAKADDGLVIFYYSGHGGSGPFADTGKDEDDGKDEFYCLYDTYLRDNEMWQMIKTCKGRIYIVNDCCHSQTIYRSPMIKLAPPLAWDHSLDENYPFSMLCWSGCPDNTYSYGASTGGQFTNALLRHYKEGVTYEQLWEAIKKDRVLRMYENPQSTVLGDKFTGKRTFR